MLNLGGKNPVKRKKSNIMIYTKHYNTYINSMKTSNAQIQSLINDSSVMDYVLDSFEISELPIEIRKNLLIY